MTVASEMKLHPVLKSFIPVVKALGKTFGSHCEIVLHDISKTESSVIAIANGHITNRSVGSPATDFLLEMVNNADKKEDMILNYESKTKDGKTLKSSTILIRDENAEIIGALCVNLDLTSISITKNFIEEISRIELKEENVEKFPEDADDFLNIMIENSLSKINKPIPYLPKEDRLKIVSYLEENNIFNIKGAVDVLAEKLSVSRYTIYNYLDEVRGKNKN